MLFMNTLSLDTYAVVKRLTAAGLDEKQAEVIVNTIHDVREADVKSLATKSDLRELELKLSGEMTLLKWMLGLVIAGIIALILKSYFPH
jgi:predicted transcriptional regulator